MTARRELILRTAPSKLPNVRYGNALRAIALKANALKDNSSAKVNP
jgi:hypothetical protein